jgi:hypothetical protein
MPRPTKRAKKSTAMNVAAAESKEELRQERRLEEQRIGPRCQQHLENFLLSAHDVNNNNNTTIIAKNSSQHC